MWTTWQQQYFCVNRIYSKNPAIMDAYLLTSS